MPINLHHLRTFAHVVRAGGIGRAARESGVSQPAVSRAIRELERSVGAQLLERGPQGFRPTPFGIDLFQHAQTIVAAEHDVELLVAGGAGSTRCVIRLGASTTVATYVLPRLLRDLGSSHPHIDVVLTVAHTRLLEQELRHHEIDIALVEATSTDPYLDAIPWMLDEMVVIAAPDHPLASRRRITPAVLAKERFVLREPESGTRSIVLRGLADVGIVPRESIAVDGTEVIKQLVAESAGVGIVSRVAIADQLACGRLVVLDIPALRIRRPFTQLSIRGRRMPPEIERFVTLLKAVVPPLHGA